MSTTVHYSCTEFWS